MTFYTFNFRLITLSPNLMSKFFGNDSSPVLVRITRMASLNISAISFHFMIFVHMVSIQVIRMLIYKLLYYKRKATKL